MLLLLSVVYFAATVTAHCLTTKPVATGPPKCAHYPDGYFINDFSNCQSYFYCPNKISPPYPGKCSAPYNFDQTRQMCNHPDDYSCPSVECAAEDGKLKIFTATHNIVRCHVLDSVLNPFLNVTFEIYSRL